jgi:hypothetical protein
MPDRPIACTSWPAARAVHTQLWKTRRQILGEQHTDTLNVMNDLANAMREMSDLTAARSLLERTVELTTRLLGEDAFSRGITRPRRRRGAALCQPRARSGR